MFVSLGVCQGWDRVIQRTYQCIILLFSMNSVQDGMDDVAGKRTLIVVFLRLMVQIWHKHQRFVDVAIKLICTLLLVSDSIIYFSPCSFCS